MFLDSGSFTLRTKALRFAKAHPKKGKWDFYNTDDAKAYIDGYAAFVKEHRDVIDVYASIDVIGNPELSWRNLKYLEKEHGLQPLPVVHLGTPLRWLYKHLDAGYEFIALGGMVGKELSHTWLDACFKAVCKAPHFKPSVKYHGFGVTNHEAIIGYPWWSVDSTAWLKISIYGQICIPKKRAGKFVFMERPYRVFVGQDSPYRRMNKQHVHAFSGAEQKVVAEWLEYIGVPLGDKTTPGIVNSQDMRCKANLLFFEALCHHLPAWPFPYKEKHRGFIERE